MIWGDMPLMRCQCNDILLFLNTFRPRQNCCHFPDDIFKCIFLNENVWILIKISLKFVPKGPINNNIPTLVQIMAWHRPGDKPLSEPMMVRLLTQICVIRPQWVNGELRNNRNIKQTGLMMIYTLFIDAYTQWNDYFRSLTMIQYDKNIFLCYCWATNNIPI